MAYAPGHWAADRIFKKIGNKHKKWYEKVQKSPFFHYDHQEYCVLIINSRFTSSLKGRLFIVCDKEGNIVSDENILQAVCEQEFALIYLGMIVEELAEDMLRDKPAQFHQLENTFQTLAALEINDTYTEAVHESVKEMVTFLKEKHDIESQLSQVSKRLIDVYKELNAKNHQTLSPSFMTELEEDLSLHRQLKADFHFSLVQYSEPRRIVAKNMEYFRSATDLNLKKAENEILQQLKLEGETIERIQRFQPSKTASITEACAYYFRETFKEHAMRDTKALLQYNLVTTE